MRHRLLFALHIITIVMLLLSVAVGLEQIYTNYRKYGESYQITTTIAGESSTQTMTLPSQLAGLMFVLWIAFLLVALLFMPNTIGQEQTKDPTIPTQETH